MATAVGHAVGRTLTRSGGLVCPGTGLPVAPCPADLVELLPRGGPPVGPPLYNVRGEVTPPPQAWPDTGRLPLPLPLPLPLQNFESQNF